MVAAALSSVCASATSSENLLPRGRYFPASPDPDRWLSSTPVTVTLP